LEPYLTEREKNVLTLLALGYTNKEISEKLHISIHTTKAHLESIYEKWNVTNRVQAVIKAISLNKIKIQDILPD